MTLLSAGSTFSGIPIHLWNTLEDGKTIITVDPATPSSPIIIVGTAPLSEAASIVREIVLDVFGEHFLRSIKAWEPDQAEMMMILRGEKIPWLDLFCPECSEPFDRRSWIAAHSRHLDGELVHESCCVSHHDYTGDERDHWNLPF